MEKKITLRLGNAGWMARFHGQAGKETRELFGTDEIPTAFTAATPVAKVRERIEFLNPGYTVEVKE